MDIAINRPVDYRSEIFSIIWIEIKPHENGSSFALVYNRRLIDGLVFLCPHPASCQAIGASRDQPLDVLGPGSVSGPEF